MSESMMRSFIGRTPNELVVSLNLCHLEYNAHSMKNNGTNKNTERLHSLSVPWMREERIRAY